MSRYSSQSLFTRVSLAETRTWRLAASGSLLTRKLAKQRLNQRLLKQGFVSCLLVGGLSSVGYLAAADMPNTCPVDGCEVKIAGVEKSGEELKLTLDANFKPDNAKNHFHMWWGEQYKPEQVGRNAKNEYNVEQGKWHRHDDYPEYITTGSASVSVRDGATTLCVTAADGDHNVLDAQNFHCVDVSSQL